MVLRCDSVDHRRSVARLTPNGWDIRRWRTTKISSVAFIDYAQGFIDWVEQDAGGVVSVPDPSMFSTQKFEPVPAP